MTLQLLLYTTVIPQYTEKYAIYNHSIFCYIIENNHQWIDQVRDIVNCPN